MDVLKFLGLRPKSDTVDEVSAALDRARSAHDEVAARLADLQRRRPEVLLSGNEGEIAAVEQQLADARAEAERAAAIVPHLEVKLLRLRRQAEIDRVRRQVVETTAKVEGVGASIRTRYVELAEAMVREVLRPEAEALAALTAARAELRRLQADPQVADLVSDLRLPPAPLLVAAPRLASVLPREDLGATVNLPGLTGYGPPQDSAAAFWPPPASPKAGLVAVFAGAAPAKKAS
jgi:hypothetical protein